MAKYQEILDKLNELTEGFGRLDERTQNIYHLDEKQEAHLSKLNDSILNHATQISSNKTSIRWIKYILIGTGILGGIGGSVTGLVNWLG